MKDPVASTTTDDCFHQYLLGVQIVQRWGDVWAWEHALNQLPHVRTIVEIGTLYGGLSLFLAMHAIQRGGLFYTLDTASGANAAVRTPLGQLVNMAGSMLTGDCWDESGGKKMLRDIFANPNNHPLLLLCDGGNKPREMQTFIPMLQAGDYVAVHDWENEINHPDLVSVKHRIEPLFWQACEAAVSMTRFWKVLP